MGMSHIPEDRHKHGLVLDYSLEDNLVLQRYFEPEFTDKAGFLRRNNIRTVRGKAHRAVRRPLAVRAPSPLPAACPAATSRRPSWPARSTRIPELLVAVQPTRGLDVGAIEYIHKQLVAQRDAGKAVLLVSLELDEVMDVPDRILVMYEGEIVGELDPKNTTAGGAGPVHGRRQERRGEGMKKNLLKNSGVQSLLASLVCIVLGLLIGYIVLLFINPAGAGEAIVTVIKNFLTYNKPACPAEVSGQHAGQDRAAADVRAVHPVCL